jgi:hypothetical protein
MLSKSKIKYIRSLAMKKFRNETGCFLAEGKKLVKDMIPFSNNPIIYLDKQEKHDLHLDCFRLHLRNDDAQNYSAHSIRIKKLRDNKILMDWG